MGKAKKLEYIKDFELADYEGDSDVSAVGILVGLDFYHKFLAGGIVKETENPSCLESVLGWILSAPLCVENKDTSVHCFDTHVMRCLTGNICRVWEKWYN